MSKERDMTEEAKAAEAEADQTQDSQTEGEGGEDSGPDPETEDRARRMGWAPKEEFKGDAKRWVDAETFVQRGEEIMPILKANSRKLEADNAELKRTLKDLTDHMGRSEARMYQKALRDIQAAQRKAAEDGDLAQYDQLEQQKREVVKEATQGGPKQASADRIEPEALEWRERNSWFDNNADMATFATTHHELLLRTSPGLSLEKNLEEVTKAVKRAFPEKFTNPKRNGASQVEGVSQPRGKGGKDYAALPADAKAACDRLVKQKVLTKEQFCKDYEWS